MSRLDSEQQVRQLAYDLGLPVTTRPVDDIVRYCVEKIRPWIPNAIRSIQEIEQIVCRKLDLCFEEVWNEQDLNILISKYAAMGELVFLNLPNTLDNATFAELIQKMRTTPDSPERYVAIIDCRTPHKEARRFFTRWHEIAHLLALTPKMSLPFFRSATEAEKCPLESVMDVIAAEVGFFDPLFRPLVEAEVAREGRLTLAGVRRIKEEFHSEASVHATAIAAIKRCPVPAVLITGKLAYKAAEARAVAAGQMSLFSAPELKLRAVYVTESPNAKENGIVIHPNMRIPDTSIIAGVHRGSMGLPDMGTEDLGTWEHSGGKRLNPMAVHIDAWAWEDSVHALITAINFQGPSQN